MPKFTVSWEGARVPKSIVLPDGSERKVSYMRDGICVLSGGVSATYTRISNTSAEFEMIDSKEKMDSALNDYQGKQKGNDDVK